MPRGPRSSHEPAAEDSPDEKLSEQQGGGGDESGEEALCPRRPTLAVEEEAPQAGMLTAVEDTSCRALPDRLAWVLSAAARRYAEEHVDEDVDEGEPDDEEEDE